MYTVSVLFSNNVRKYGEFHHIVKISFGGGFNLTSIDEKNFESTNFPFDESLNLHSQTANYLIYPNTITSMTFEKEKDQ